MAWYNDWFNSKYYHILYGKRNDNEAESFISKALQILNLEQNDCVLDLACGKGRHAKYLAQHLLNVWGVDLSENSILNAKLMETENLHFEIHDMRKVFKPQYFDCVFNLFTSFGYFENVNDNIETLKAVKENLKPNGVFIQDYFNTEKVKHQMIPEHTQTIDNIEFKLNKKIELNAESKINTVVKTIQFEVGGKPFQFQEKVSLFTLVDFETMYAKVGLNIQAIYGDYHFNPFNVETSDRLIIITKPQ